MSLNRKQLTQASCSHPECQHREDEPMFLHAKCHPREGHQVSYHPSTGTLEVRCQRCKQLVAEIEVAP
jgi:ribosomal protein S27E